MTLSSEIGILNEWAAKIHRPVRLMEVCGTHTVTAFRSGLRSLLPEQVRLLSGPGCPVCVTPTAWMDLAIAIAREPSTRIATFGDLVRVPGSDGSLELARARGARVDIVYSPMDALAEARRNPRDTVVFLGVGFETTAPAVAWTLKRAQAEGVRNFTVLCSHKVMPPAMMALLRQGDVAVDGFLCPGHVSVVIGSKPYEPICRDFHLPCVISGFEPRDMLIALGMLLKQIAERRAEVEVQYSRSVSREGNREALAAMQTVFEPCDSEWRGLGVIGGSGLSIRSRYADHDAQARYANVRVPEPVPVSGCRCGDVLRGAMTPMECPLFGHACVPENPVGACMVSAEGTCAAYYQYGRQGGPEPARSSKPVSL